MKRKIRNLKRRWRKLAWYNQTSILLLIAAAISQMLLLNIVEAILVLWVLYLYCDQIAECRKVAYTYYNTSRFRYKMYYIDKHIELLKKQRKLIMESAELTRNYLEIETKYNKLKIKKHE
jgi:hypothetical protein